MAKFKPSILNVIINHARWCRMYAMTGIIKGNTVLTNDNSIEKYNGRKVIITVLDDEKLFTISDSLINQNMDAYQELAK